MDETTLTFRFLLDVASEVAIQTASTPASASMSPCPMCSTKVQVVQKPL